MLIVQPLDTEAHSEYEPFRLAPDPSQKGQVRHSQHSHVVSLQLSSATCGVQGALGQYCGGAQWPGASWMRC